ncbi:MAG TPA: tRNA (adenosine(37)-N6)-threonylcarbamoyltransferase complex transferase subunit TsaD [Pirellulaceae bacterium]|nr:tRNA (adenosine(37)-N6)-threonylcarbamoyltransferase complex transferase subunit TsaD [Pirellulaceae bacterium]
MNILTIETTCDETAAAVINDQLQVLGSSLATQVELHREFQGVVPEIAARAHLERILPVIDQAIRRAGIAPGDLSAVAVATTPGLANSLLVGLTAAKSLALAWDIPLIEINHLHAHVFACRMAAGRDVFPCLGLVVSGGHTHLFDFPTAIDPILLGGTIDDAAGEAFDKVATMLGLGFPGGPALALLAEEGDDRAFDFPQSYLNDPRIVWSFSGLKTAVRYTLAGKGKVDWKDLVIPRPLAANIAASFERAVVEVLVEKTFQALEQTGRNRLCVGGGVASNRRLRANLAHRGMKVGVEVLISPPELCTDNAVMGAIALESLRAGRFASLEIDIQPGLLRSELPPRPPHHKLG